MTEFERGVAEPSPRARLIRCTVILSTLTALYVTAVGSLSHSGAVGRMHRSSSTASISMHARDHSRTQCAYDAELSTISWSPRQGRSWITELGTEATTPTPPPIPRGAVGGHPAQLGPTRLTPS